MVQSFGSVEDAVMRWMGHNEVMGSLVACWNTLGGFDDGHVAVLRAKASPDAPSTEEASKEKRHESRLEVIGAISGRTKRLMAELRNMQRRSALCLDVVTVGPALDRWLIKYVWVSHPCDPVTVAV